MHKDRCSSHLDRSMRNQCPRGPPHAERAAPRKLQFCVFCSAVRLVPLGPGRTMRKWGIFGDFCQLLHLFFGIVRPSMRCAGCGKKPAKIGNSGFRRAGRPVPAGGQLHVPINHPGAARPVVCEACFVANGRATVFKAKNSVAAAAPPQQLAALVADAPALAIPFAMPVAVAAAADAKVAQMLQLVPILSLLCLLWSLSRTWRSAVPWPLSWLWGAARVRSAARRGQHNPSNNAVSWLSSPPDFVNAVTAARQAPF
jgi:hypothetical protein